MKRYQTWFQIADVPVCMITPAPLYVEPAFQEYLSVPREGAVRCFFSQVEALPKPAPNAAAVFDDGMHRILWSPELVQQYFYIPYLHTCMLKSREPDLYQQLGRFPCEEHRLYFRPEAAGYFSTAFGCFNAAKIERLLIGRGRLILHASYIQWQGRAIAFTADSGVGKSTQAALWERYRGAETVNGDRMAFGMRDGIMTAYGLPVAGSSGVFLNKTLPIQAVVVLGRGAKSEISRQRPAAVIRDLLKQVTVNRWDQCFMDAVCRLLTQLLATVPVYRLLATPDKDAVECLAQTLGKEENVLAQHE